MAAEVCVLPDRSLPFSSNSDIKSVMMCANCLQKESQLDDILSQLKSLQKIVELLQQDSSIEHGRDSISPSSNSWNAGSKRRYSEAKSMKPHSNHPS
jgi:hypothetical protein